MSLYRIRKADGREYGPMDADALRDCIRNGTAFARTLAAIEGASVWQQLSEFPEFTEALALTNANPRSTPPLLPPRPMAAPSPAKKFLAKLAAIPLGILIVAGGVVAIFVIGQGHFKQARWQAMSNGCASALPRLGQAARDWAKAHGDRLPPDWLSMSNQLQWPPALICPADGRKIYQLHEATWSNFNLTNASYQYLAPGQSMDQARTQVVFRCLIHRHAYYGDGRVVLQPLGPPPKNLVIFE